MSDFVWTDELVKEFAHHCNKHGMFVTTEALMGKFKEEKTKRDWEVVEMVGNYLGMRDVLFKLGHNRDYFYPDYVLYGANKYAFDKLIENECVIYSVKRLSDGEVFSIGDEVVYLVPNYKGVIKRMEVVNDGKDVYAYGEDDRFIRDIGSLQKAVKPKPLFVTEDGVEIFENDRAWFVSDDFEIEFYDFVVTNNREINLKHFPEEYKYFSSEDAANKYVFMNKTLLSLKEIHEAMFLEYDATPELMFAKIRMKAKEKLSK